MGNLVIFRGLNGNLRRNPIHLWFSMTALENETPTNHSIRRMTRNVLETKWHGRVVALKFSGTQMLDYIDASLLDLVDMSDYFIGYNRR